MLPAQSKSTTRESSSSSNARSFSDNRNGYQKPTKVAFVITFLLMFSFSSFATASEGTLTILNINGVDVEILVKSDVASDTLPQEITDLFYEMQANKLDSLLNHQFDISQMSKPEEDASDVVINTCKIFREMMKENIATGN